MWHCAFRNSLKSALTKSDKTGASALTSAPDFGRNDEERGSELCFEQRWSCAQLVKTKMKEMRGKLWS